MNIADFLSRNGKLSVKSYATGLYKRKHKPDLPLNNNLVAAFWQEINKRSFVSDPKAAERLLANLLENRILQSAHHLCLTNGPGFTAIDLLSIIGQPANEPYWVGAYSGIPFSNSAWSGAVCFQDCELQQIFNSQNHLFNRLAKSLRTSLAQGASEKKVYFIPGAFKNRLVFGASLASEVIEVFESLNQRLKKRLPNPLAYDNFSDWALDFCQRVQRYVLAKASIYYFDINRVLKNFLIAELKSSEIKSLAARILVDKEIQQYLAANHPQLPIFVKPTANLQKVELVTARDYAKSQSITAEAVVAELDAKRVCPATFLIFSALCFENDFRCLGSFLQLKYLPEFFKIYEQLISKLKLKASLRHDFKNDFKSENWFAGARFPKGISGHAFDFFVQERTIDQKSFVNQTMNYFWQDLPLKM